MQPDSNDNIRKRNMNQKEMFNCLNCDSLKNLVDTKMPIARRMSSSWQKNYFCSNQVNPWINLFLKTFWAVSQLGQKWMIAWITTARITTAPINQNCSTSVAVKSWTCAAGKSCAVYMCGSKKNVWYAWVVAKNMLDSKVMNMCGSLG